MKDIWKHFFKSENIIFIRDSFYYFHNTDSFLNDIKRKVNLIHRGKEIRLMSVFFGKLIAFLYDTFKKSPKRKCALHSIKHTFIRHIWFDVIQIYNIKHITWQIISPRRSCFLVFLIPVLLKIAILFWWFFKDALSAAQIIWHEQLNRLISKRLSVVCKRSLVTQL